MIRVKRPNGIPAVLQNQGAAATKRLCADYDASPAAYTSGKATFTFNPKIYGTDEVKSALRQAQHDKCCFCESKVTHIAFGDVEHFRPKKAFRQRRGGPLVRPGYFWLAYEWTNLFFCCQQCNQRFKENLFPLKRVRLRARSHRHDLTVEEPLFVNPEEDPSVHLGFRAEFLYAHRRSRRGKATIDALGLNRQPLVEKRRDYLALVRALVDSRNLLVQEMHRAENAGAEPPPGYRGQVAKHDALLVEFSGDAAEYAAMVRALLAE